MILASDEASLYLQATLQRVWAPIGQTPLVRLDASRTKINFYGTLNLLTGQELVMRSDQMNAAATARHLTQLLDAFPDVPILLLWDKAPWHKGPAIRELLAANPRLEIISFPTAAPELNPQEHVWKAVRTAVSHNHSIARLPDLADRWEAHLSATSFPCSLLHTLNYQPLRDLYTMFI